MTAHAYDLLKHHGVGIPEDAYDEVGLSRVLEALVSCDRVRTLPQNQAEVERLRGTPNEPIPCYSLEVFYGVRFVDDFRGDRSTTILSRQSWTVREMQECGTPLHSMIVDNVLHLAKSPEQPTQIVVTKNRAQSARQSQLDQLLTYSGSNFIFEEQVDNVCSARAGDGVQPASGAG